MVLLKQIMPACNAIENIIAKFAGSNAARPLAPALTHTCMLLIQVRHLDAKREKEVKREDIVKFLSDAISLQFKNPTIWS
jgi:hypothetical protein